MTPRIEFDYQLRHLGWAYATIRDDTGQEAHMIASYLTRALDDLLYALVKLVQGYRYAAASWEAEPAEYRWILRRGGDRDDAVALTVLRFDSRFPSRPEHDGTPVFSTETDLTTVVSTIAGEARRLLTDLGERRYAEQWHAGPFPRIELEALEDWVHSSRDQRWDHPPGVIPLRDRVPRKVTTDQLLELNRVAAEHHWGARFNQAAITSRVAPDERHVVLPILANGLHDGDPPPYRCYVWFKDAGARTRTLIILDIAQESIAELPELTAAQLRGLTATLLDQLPPVNLDAPTRRELTGPANPPSQHAQNG
jgi:hypothetical protein